MPHQTEPFKKIPFDIKHMPEGKSCHDCPIAVVDAPSDTCGYHASRCAAPVGDDSSDHEAACPSAIDAGQGDELSALSPSRLLLSTMMRGDIPPDIKKALDRVSSLPGGEKLLNKKLLDILFSPDKKKYWNKEILEMATKVETMLKSSIGVCNIFELDQAVPYHLNEARLHIEKVIMILRKRVFEDNNPTKDEEPEAPKS